MTEAPNQRTGSAGPGTRGIGWANRLTIGRGLLSLVLWGVLAVIRRTGGDDTALWWSAFGIFVVTAATDSLDGYIARARGEVSVFGRIADPFVDKLLILGSCVFLLGIPGIPDLLPPWAVAVILARELLVTALRASVEGAGGNFQAGIWGKGKMAIQCIAIGAVLLHGAGVDFVRTSLGDLGGGPESFTLTHALVLAAAAATVLSGVEYVVRAVAVLRAVPPPPRA